MTGKLISYPQVVHSLKRENFDVPATTCFAPESGSRQPSVASYVEKLLAEQPAKTGIPKKVRLRERVNAMRQRRRRLLVKLGLKVKGK